MAETVVASMVCQKVCPSLLSLPNQRAPATSTAITPLSSPDWYLRAQMPFWSSANSESIPNGPPPACTHPGPNTANHKEQHEIQLSRAFLRGGHPRPGCNRAHRSSALKTV